MNDSKDVSVIIPLFNCKKYIGEAIQSVLDQTLLPKEIIIVDDGSTDNVKAVLHRFKNKIKYFYQKNKGPSAARNLGIKQSNSELIAFLDSDDLWHPRKLEKQINLISDNFGFIFCNKENIYENDKKLKEQRNYPAKYCTNPIKYLLTDFFASPSTVLVKRSLLIHTGGFDESLINCEDSDLWIKLAKLTKFTMVEEPLVTYRIRKDSISNSINYNQAVVMFHQPLLKNKELIVDHLKMSSVEFEQKLKESKEKLRKIFKLEK